jgi:DNA-3-methyladenine glycosylase I
VGAAIYNAQQIIRIQKEFGSFKSWLDKNHPMKLDEWVILFKKTFKFTGGEITKEFLRSTGYIKGAHNKNCHVYNKIIRQKPKWNR